MDVAFALGANVFSAHLCATVSQKYYRAIKISGNVAQTRALRLVMPEPRRRLTAAQWKAE